MADEPPVKPLTAIEYAHIKAPRKPVSIVWIGLWVFLGYLVVLFFMLLPGATHGLHSPRSVAPRVRSASNLRLIGQAILLYAKDSHGQYPNALGDLLNQDITSDVFISPNSTDTPAYGPTTQATIAILATPGHCSYIYLGKDLTSQQAATQPTMVIAYEPAAINNNQGGNVLFGDGHVEFDAVLLINSIQSQIAAHIWPVYLPAHPTTVPTINP